MKNPIRSYLNVGIKTNTEASLAIRIRLLNVLNISCLIVSIAYAIINSYFHTLASVINLIAAFGNIIIYWLISTKRHTTGFLAFMLITNFVGVSFTFLYGKYIAADLLFCTGIAYSIAIFENKYRMAFGVILNLICFIAAQYYYENYVPFFHEVRDHSRIFYYPNTALFLFTLFVLVFLLKTENKRYENQLRFNNADLTRANLKNEELIRNVLPREIAEELKENGYVEPQVYKNVTVMFTDFYQFTKTAENMSAIQLVHDLDEYFTEFDKIIIKYRLEKLKTIGDAYMCVAGIRDKNADPALTMVKAAIEIRNKVEEMYHQRRAENKMTWPIRIGMHSGNVVGGIIGNTKFSFDIWGDTVNTAARMESSSEPGKINISESTYEMINKQVDCTYRGKVQAKSKGELNMYFVNNLITG